MEAEKASLHLDTQQEVRSSLAHLLNPIFIDEVVVIVPIIMLSCLHRWRRSLCYPVGQWH